MTDDNTKKSSGKTAAERALAEAEERRAAREDAERDELEVGGPKGKEPTRYGDWERKGIAYDF